MENYIRFTSRIALSSFLLVSGALPALSQTPAALSQTSVPGAVFAMTNRTENNEIIAFKRSARGTLTGTGRYSTGGRGIGVDFDTQGGLRLSEALCVGWVIGIDPDYWLQNWFQRHVDGATKFNKSVELADRGSGRS